MTLENENILHLDFETKSEVNLLTRGSYQYAIHPSTKILCFCYAENDEPVQEWWPGQPIPEIVIKYYTEGKRRSIHAHAATFERLISWYVFCPDYDIPEPPMDAFYCTAAQAAARALPRNLEDLGRCLNLNIQKSQRGKQLIKMMCIPPFEWSRELEAEMVDYCHDDVVVERDAENQSAPLTDEEFEDYLVNEAINDRGIMVDLEFASAAAGYADEEIAELNAAIVKLTDGAVKTARSFKAIKEWMMPYATKDDRIRKAMTRVKTDPRTREETRKLTCDKEARFTMSNLDDLPAEVYDLIHLLDEAGRTSVSKYKAMGLLADPVDHRVRGAYFYAGAGQTLRFSSKGLQVHNLTRDCAEDPEAVRKLVLDGYELDGVMDTLASMLRPSLIAAPGHKFVVGDSASIEARVLPWLANARSAEKVLDIYRACDLDPELPDNYMLAAADIYGILAENVSKDQRQVGKVAILSLGFGGGFRAFMAMARGYRVFVTQQEADRIKKAWREANPWAPRLWKATEAAATNAVENPGEEFWSGRVYYFTPGFGDTLYAVLPSGQTLCYPEPRIEIKEKWGKPTPTLTAIKAAWKPKQGERDWPRIDLWGGLLCENNTQATAASTLKGFMRQTHSLDWPIMLHTHDEMGVEVLDDEVDEATIMMDKVMTTVPHWAPGLPLACSIWSGPRYKK